MKTIDKYLMLRREDLAFFQFIMEGYERMLTVSTEDPRAAVVKLSILPDYHEDCMLIIDWLKDHLQMAWILNY